MLTWKWCWGWSLKSSVSSYAMPRRCFARVSTPLRRVDAAFWIADGENGNAPIGVGQRSFPISHDIPHCVPVALQRLVLRLTHRLLPWT